MSLEARLVRAALGGEEPAMPPSLWARIATAPRATPALEGGVAADVAVIGAGYAGLAAAIALAQAGLQVVVVDAAEVGWGASGRNNGQVIPGLKLDPDELVSRFGSARGERLAAWAGAAPDQVFGLIERHAIACDALRKGWIQPAYTARSLATIHSRCAQWARRGASAATVERRDLEAILGTPAYVGAWIDERGGTLNPLSYARGMAEAAIGLGARLFTRTSALALARNGSHWSLATPRGSVRAAKVFVATAGYADELVKGLRRSMVPVRTAQAATAPLDERRLATILPGRQGASDTRRLLTSFRISPDRRLVMGGAWATGALDDVPLLPHLHKAGGALFAHLGTLDWEFGWSGYFPATSDHMPHLHESGDGIYCALGCNGRGIALSTALGTLVAARISGVQEADSGLEPTPMARVLFHRFRNAGIALATAVKGVQDRADRLLTR